MTSTEIYVVCLIILITVCANKAKRQADSRGELYDAIKIKLYEFIKHSWSSQKYEQGATLEDLKEYHGHEKLETGLIYTKINVLSRFRKLADVVHLEEAKNKAINDRHE